MIPIRPFLTKIQPFEKSLKIFFDPLIFSTNVIYINFEFYSDKDDVTDEEISRVREMIYYLDTISRALPETKLTSDDENTCTICYAFPIAATFKPCNHQSCRACIDHHLLNSRECFFCKANIDKVVDLTAVIIHDFTTDGKKAQSSIS